ncbi:MAG: M15 family metallopeptidase [bacterium]
MLSFPSVRIPNMLAAHHCSWHRELLRDAMEAQGFRVFRYEWWHFYYENASRYSILNLTFAEILETH